MNQINMDDWFIALEHPSGAVQDKQISIADLVGAVDSSTYRQAEGQLKASKGGRAEPERVAKYGLIIGRGKDDVSVNRLLSAVVSKIHCALNITAGGAVYITDLGSAHGTTIRPAFGLGKITLGPNKPKLLCNGDRITFGRTVTTGEVTHEPLELVVRLRYTLDNTKDDGQFISRTSHHGADLAQLERNILRVTGAQSGRYGVPASLLYESEDEDPLPRLPTFSPEPSVPAHGPPVPNEDGVGIVASAERYRDEVLVHYVPSRSPSPARDDPDSTAMPGKWYSYSSESEDGEGGETEPVVRKERVSPQASEREPSPALPPCWRTYDEEGDLIEPLAAGTPPVREAKGPKERLIPFLDLGPDTDSDDEVIGPAVCYPSKLDAKAQTSVSVRSVRSSSSPEINAESHSDEEERDQGQNEDDFAEWDEEVDEDAGMEDEVDELDEDDLDHEAEYEEYDEEEADEKEEEEEAAHEPAPAAQPAARAPIITKDIPYQNKYAFEDELDAYEARQLEWAQEEDHEPEPVPEDELHELDELEDDHPELPEEEAEQEVQPDHAPAMVSAGVQVPSVSSVADVVDQASQTNDEDAYERDPDEPSGPEDVMLSYREKYGCNWPGMRTTVIPNESFEALKAEKRRRVQTGGKLGSAVFKAVARARLRGVAKARRARKRAAAGEDDNAPASSALSDDSANGKEVSALSATSSTSSASSDESYWGPHPFGGPNILRPYTDERYKRIFGQSPGPNAFRFDFGIWGGDSVASSNHEHNPVASASGASGEVALPELGPNHIPFNKTPFGGTGGSNGFSFGKPEQSHIPSIDIPLGGPSGNNTFSLAELEQSHIPSSCGDSSSDGPVTPKYKLRPLKRTFAQARLDDLNDYTASPAETLPAYPRAYETTIIVAPSPAKRLKRVASAFGLVVLGAAIGSVGTIAGLMQLAE